MNRREALSLLAAGSAVAAGVRYRPDGAGTADQRYSQAQSYLQGLIADQQFNGAVLKIYREGAPDFNYVTGWLDGEHKRPMVEDAICQMAPMTKPVTGVCTLIF